MCYSLSVHCTCYCLLLHCICYCSLGDVVSSHEQVPDHRRQNFKAFEEHVEQHVSSCFVTESYLYNFSGLGVRVVWKLFIAHSRRNDLGTRQGDVPFASISSILITFELSFQSPFHLSLMLPVRYRYSSLRVSARTPPARLQICFLLAADARKCRDHDAHVRCALRRKCNA